MDAAGVPGRGEYLNERRGVSDLADEIKRVFEILIGFAGEADDKVAG
jgi:hypothetical protein